MVDNTPLEVSRDARITSITDELCDRLSDDDCGGDYSADGDGDGRCQVDQRQNFERIWPAASCNDEQMEAGIYQDCNDQIEELDDDAACAAFDFDEFFANCDAAAVCVDPADD